MLDIEELKIIEQIKLDYPDIDEGSVIKTVAVLKMRGLLKNNK